MFRPGMLDGLVFLGLAFLGRWWTVVSICLFADTFFCTGITHLTATRFRWGVTRDSETLSTFYARRNHTRLPIIVLARFTLQGGFG